MPEGTQRPRRGTWAAAWLALAAACSDGAASHTMPDAAAGGGGAAAHARNDAGNEAGAGGRHARADGGAVSGSGGAGGDAGERDASAPGAANDASSDAANDSGGADSPVTPGWNLVAIDTALRTYLDYVEVPASGAWTPEDGGFPLVAQWEQQSAYSALRFQTFSPGDVLTPAQIMTLLPITAPAAQSLTITDSPYDAAPAPADASDAIQAALDDAAAMATADAPVDVRVPPGTFNHSKVLSVGANVRLRRFPEDSGGELHATDPKFAAVHLAGDRSAALFLVLTIASTARETTPDASGIWIGGRTSAAPFVHDTLVVGSEVAQSASAHIVALAAEGGLWAFNYAHDGFADTYHHTGGSRFCQVVGNRAQTSADRGDDFYAFVGYQDDGDLVHHCSCIANWGRDGHARGLSAVGAGFIAFARNDIDRTQWAGIYLARESSYNSYGTFDISVLGNTVAHANLGGSHSGLLAFADAPDGSHASASLGDISNQVRRLIVRDNIFRETAAGIGNGFGIEIRSSADDVEVVGNTLADNQPPQLVVQASNADTHDNPITP